jgi:hypothetical protein
VSYRPLSAGRDSGASGASALLVVAERGGAFQRVGEVDQGGAGVVPPSMSPAIWPSRQTVLHGLKSPWPMISPGAQVAWPLDHTLVAGGR